MFVLELYTKLKKFLICIYKTTTQTAFWKDLTSGLIYIESSKKNIACKSFQ